MANGLGDFDPTAVIYGKFVTTSASTAAPTTLSSSPVLSVYKDNSVTQSTTGVTLTVDFDGVTGFNHFAVDTSADGTFYSGGSFFDVVITTGTVGGTSAVGYCVGQFTLRKTSALKPTTASRTLNITATGEGGIDWGDIANKTATNSFTGTSMSSAQIAASVTGAVGSVTGAVGSVTGAVGSVTGAVGSVTGNVGGNVVGSVGSVAAGGLTTASFAAGVLATVPDIVAGVWGEPVPGAYAAGTAGVAVSDAADYDAAADALLNRNVAGGSSTGRLVKEAFFFLRNKWALSTGTLTVYETDDTTPSWSASVATDAAAIPIIGNTPA